MSAAAAAGLVLWVAVVTACRQVPGPATNQGARRAAAAADSGFAAVQHRGHDAMGVDQYTSTHVFRPLLDGGRIELQRDEADSAGRARILEHMGRIARAFTAGDFTLPGFVHDREVPGTRRMADRRSAIRYVVESLPRGGALRLKTADRSAVGAIHEFLAFQRMDHRAAVEDQHGE